jgi:biotin-dependent carboxylase-like uncharacterized protein
VRALGRALGERPFPGLLELASRASGDELPPAPLKQVLAAYDGEDLEPLARSRGLTAEDVIRLHSGTEYTVFMLGFSPGFAYMGLVPDAIAAPRRSTPRTRVPAGSIGVAGPQTGIYPTATPGGWNLIGRTGLALFDPGADPPTFFQPGDRVRFVAVDRVEDARGLREPPRPRGDPVLEVLEGGLLTTVQDEGRPGLQKLGVPVTGAMDAPALRAANLLVGNPPGAAALECAVTGPRLRVLRTTTLAITGADLQTVLERADMGPWSVPPWTSFLARADSILSFAGRRAGCRAYLAVAGGIDVPEVLGSRSTDLNSGIGGHRGRALRPGDVLHAPVARGRSGRRWPAPRQSLAPDASVRVLLGPQEDYFTDEAVATFLSADYVLAPSSDRMGCRLEGPVLAHRGPREIVSDGNVLGSIQVPPDGRPIVMLADRGSTGGYPKIATVIGADVARLGQLLPGDRLRFEAVTLGEAIEALRECRQAEARAIKDLARK